MCCLVGPTDGLCSPWSVQWSGGHGPTHREGQLDTCSVPQCCSVHQQLLSFQGKCPWGSVLVDTCAIHLVSTRAVSCVPVSYILVYPCTCVCVYLCLVYRRVSIFITMVLKYFFIHENHMVHYITNDNTLVSFVSVLNFQK